MRSTRHIPRACAGIVAHARQLANEPGSDDKSLVDAFVARNEHAAFALIVQRHGPMVLRVCRRVLGDRHAAEDAFQGTFLILAQRAKRIRNRASLASWLHGTALRVAAAARRAAVRHRPHESVDARASAEPGPALVVTWHEVQALVDQEVQALPVIYREAFVRCCLEHASCAEVARELGISEPTVRNRLARARKRLQGRLGWRGISLGTVIAMLAASAAEAVPAAPLVASTAAAACALAAGRDLTTLAVREPVRSLVAGASRNVLLTKLKVTVGVLALCTALCAFAAGEPGDQPNPPVDRALAEAEAKPAVPNPDAALELAKLEGTWVTEKYDEVFFYVFTGTKCTVINATKKEANESRVEVDPTKSPKRLNLTEPGKRTWELIYELKGDSLRLAAPLEVVRGAPGGGTHATRAPRPTEFKDVDSKSTLLTLKRLTPAVAKSPATAPLEVTKSVPDVQVLEAQVRVKQAQVRAAEVRLHTALERATRPTQTDRNESDHAKAELEAASAELDVRKAELAEAEARLRAAKASRPSEAPEPSTGPPPKGAPESDAPTLQTSSRTVRLPLALDPVQVAKLKEFQLYASDDEGQTWKLAAVVGSEADSVTFEAPRAGTYWLATRVVLVDGTATPRDPTTLTATLRVQITDKPVSLPQKTPTRQSNKFDEFYGLKDGEAVKLVPHTPESLAVRNDYLAKMGGRKYSAKETIIFTYSNGIASVDRALWRDPLTTGVELDSIIQDVVPEIVSAQHNLKCNLNWRTRRLAVDWVVRRDAKFEDRVAGLARALSGVFGEPIALDVKESDRAVTVASGTFKVTPRPWRLNGEIDVYATEKVVDKKLSPLGDYAEGWGEIHTFLRTLGEFCGRGEIVPIGVTGTPDTIKWYTHARGLGEGNAPQEDRDPEAVLKNVSEQTGLTFKVVKPKIITVRKLSAK